jgi:hypothetical protein
MSCMAVHWLVYNRTHFCSDRPLDQRACAETDRFRQYRAGSYSIFHRPSKSPKASAAASGEYFLVFVAAVGLLFGAYRTNLWVLVIPAASA